MGWEALSRSPEIGSRHETTRYRGVPGAMTLPEPGVERPRREQDATPALSRPERRRGHGKLGPIRVQEAQLNGPQLACPRRRRSS